MTSIDLENSLNWLNDWVSSYDDHRAARLPWIKRAAHLLPGTETADPSERQELADCLERWRYQHLDQWRAAEDLYDKAAEGEWRTVADTLDSVANSLAGHAVRAPRWPRAAVQERRFGDAETAVIHRAMDPHTDLEELCQEAAAATCSPRTVLLYAPIYLSSHCINHCVYCGFRYPHAIERRHLGREDALRQAEILTQRGLRHILLVAGDFPSLTTTEYFVAMIRMLVENGCEAPIEIAPQSTASYTAMAAAGAAGVTLYQETYDERLYAQYHPRGTKVSYDWRLEGPERAAEAGFGQLGLGFLLGLADPIEDLEALVRHAAYLAARFPSCRLAFSLPRIREAPEGFAAPFPVDDQQFVRMYCGLRLAFPGANLVLSTREQAEMRNRLAKICITQLSAGSCTTPGGYGEDRPRATTDHQFPVCDTRTVEEVTASLRQEGLLPAFTSGPVPSTACRLRQDGRGPG